MQEFFVKAIARIDGRNQIVKEFLVKAENPDKASGYISRLDIEQRRAGDEPLVPFDTYSLRCEPVLFEEFDHIEIYDFRIKRHLVM
jgi:hypothetical protein